MKDDNTIFRLTFDDVETILGRSLTDDEKDLFLNKFSIDSWSDEVECFLDCYDIKNKD